MTDFDGLPLAFHLIGGEVHDSPQLPILLGIGPGVTPCAILTDKGYDAKSNRAAARAAAIVPIIPGAEDHGPQPEILPGNPLQRPSAYRAGGRQTKTFQADHPRFIC